jgi:poly(3-hydroxyoctanoate) depolymerase
MVGIIARSDARLELLTMSTADREARERIVRVGGLGLQVREVGHGPPVLLLNGIGAHTGMWRTLEQQLPATRVIGFDAPGAGRSQTPRVPLGLTGHARVARDLLDALGEEQVDVLGYSFGGLVAQHLARLAPERVRRLVLAATTPGWGGVAGSLRAMVHISTPLRYHWRPYYERSIGELAGGRARRDAEWLARHGDERRRHPPGPVGYAWQMAALSVPPGSLPWLHELGHPTLVTAGDDDPLLPIGNSLLLAERIPRARFLRARGEGHLLLLDAESAAYPVIREFLASEDLASSAAVKSTVAVDRAMVQTALPARPQPHLIWALNTATRAIYWRSDDATASRSRRW